MPDTANLQVLLIESQDFFDQNNQNAKRRDRKRQKLKEMYHGG
jgi:hypothetical protein